MDLMLDQQIAQVEKVEESISSCSVCSQNSDSSFDLENKANNKSHLKQLASDQNGDDKKRKGKFGLKYAKISNRQRQALIERSAAKDLSINFSTAKAIMQIFRREGRVTKKIIREIKQKTNKNLGQNNEENIQKKSQFEGQNQKFVKVEAIQDNNETNLYQQAEEANRHQALIIQQLNAQVQYFLESNQFFKGYSIQRIIIYPKVFRKALKQQIIKQYLSNLYLQSRVNQLQQDKLQLNSKCELLVIQYHQIQQMAQQFLQPCMFQYPAFAQ